ncbi:MAG: hypothetical protein PWQ82_207 [Thermosediminibacterales bacterium]|nr:hypothetical protein [Thermosediminibacterales bacterium]MDK2835229.1 hypothetical protein [Thermosediminibacterales bacterium]
MPQMDIRQVILSGLKGESKENIREFIQDAINTREENALPGLGILFEAIWQKSDANQKDTIMNWIEGALK